MKTLKPIIEDKICMIWCHQFLTLEEKRIIFFGLYIYYLDIDNDLAEIARFLSGTIMWNIMLNDIEKGD